MSSGSSERPPAAVARGAYQPLVRATASDIALNATIPLACYWFVKKVVSPSDLVALLAATAFPTLKGGYDVIRYREVSPVSVLVLLGIGTSIAALFLGGDPRLLLVRESLFTGAFGIFCLVSLAFPKPIMFYFGRYFMAGRDVAKRAVFDARWRDPIARRAHRLVTTVWGVVYTGEFVVRVLMVYRLPAAVVLAVSPVVMGVATIGTIVWTFRYAYRVRARIEARA